MIQRYDHPPSPIDPADATRWSETRRRVRLLEGCWAVDLEEKLRVQFGLVRRAAMGPKSLGRNLFKRICEELSSLYLEEPRARHAIGGELPGFLSPLYLHAGSAVSLADLSPAQRDLAVKRGLVEVAHPGLLPPLWLQMRQVQAYTLGLRQMLVKPQWSYRERKLLFRPVRPDTVTIRCLPDAPDTPVAIRELVWRPIDGRGCWTWEEYDITDLGAPVWRVLLATQDGKEGADVTAHPHVYGRYLSGESYPWRWTQGGRAGVPFLPHELYHAENKGSIWDAFTWIELVEGALDVASMWTFFIHCIFRASWPQRWAMGASVAGATTQDGEGDARRQDVPADPSSLIHLEADPSVQNPQVGQWSPAANIKELQESIAAFEAGAVALTGIDGANLVRSSGDAWSGAALSISRDGKREAQRVYAPQFRPRDVSLIEKSAAIANIVRRAGAAGALPYDVPESGYRLDYAVVPLSPQEQEARREHNNDLIAQGRLSVVDAYQSEHPGLTREEALASLERIAEDNAQHKTKLIVSAPPAAQIAPPAAPLSHPQPPALKE